MGKVVSNMVTSKPKPPPPRKPLPHVLLVVPEAHEAPPKLFYVAAMLALTRGVSEPVRVLVAGTTPPGFEFDNKTVRVSLNVSLDTMQAALRESEHTHVAWGMQATPIISRRRPLEAVWSWCKALPCAELHGRPHASVAVQVRLGPGASAPSSERDLLSELDPLTERHLTERDLLVRSTLSAEWVRVRGRVRVEDRDRFRFSSEWLRAPRATIAQL